ncbi:hypothetical protein LDENG_00050890 [Lucifuga dentata]|nr:hypothetical protein LDENG_00050890 [Lucifuga dentata]
MALVSCWQDSNSASYCQYINSLSCWFDNSFLDFNVTKIKEKCLGGSRRAASTDPTYKPISLKGQGVEQVTHFKYVGTVIDNKLTYQDNVDCIYKKASTLLFLGN